MVLKDALPRMAMPKTATTAMMRRIGSKLVCFLFSFDEVCFIALIAGKWSGYHGPGLGRR